MKKAEEILKQNCIKQQWDKQILTDDFTLEVTIPSMEEYANQFKVKMWGCYACGKLLRIYATQKEADEARTRWSTECIVIVKEVVVGDGGA
jgi:hypothetical protein